MAGMLYLSPRSMILTTSGPARTHLVSLHTMTLIQVFPFEEPTVNRDQENLRDARKLLFSIIYVC